MRGNHMRIYTSAKHRHDRHPEDAPLSIVHAAGEWILLAVGSGAISRVVLSQADIDILKAELFSDSQLLSTDRRNQ
jgi:hypothetical protein